MRGILVAFSVLRGFGQLVLADGRSFQFSMSACPGGVPLLHHEMEVHLEESSRAGTYVARALPISSGERERIPGLLEYWGDFARAVCFDERASVMRRVKFPATAWASSARPEYGMSVECYVSADRFLAEGSNAHDRTSNRVEAAVISEAARKRCSPYLSVPSYAATFERDDSEPGLLVSMRARPTSFPHVADGGVALADNEPEHLCEVCEGRPGRGGVGSTLAGAELESACDECVLAGRVVYAKASEFSRYAAHAHPEWSLAERDALAERLAAEFNRIPHMVIQIQDVDWPVCPCADVFTDYWGHPANRTSFNDFVSLGGRLFRSGVVHGPGECAELSESDPDWIDVDAFGCARCGKRYFTFQYT